MRPKLNMDKLRQLPTADQMFNEKYGAEGTVNREEFEAKARAWYYAEVLKNARKQAGLTQAQLANRIGKDRNFVSSVERGETELQLSTFLMMSNAVGMRFTLAY